MFSKLFKKLANNPDKTAINIGVLSYVVLYILFYVFDLDTLLGIEDYNGFISEICFILIIFSSLFLTLFEPSKK